MSHNLLKAIEIPFRDEEHIKFGLGYDGFPAFVLLRGHDIKIPHKLLLPDKLYTNFSLLATIKPDNLDGKSILASCCLSSFVWCFVISLFPSFRRLSVCCCQPAGHSSPVWCVDRSGRTWPKQYFSLLHSPDYTLCFSGNLTNHI